MYMIVSFIYLYARMYICTYTLHVYVFMIYVNMHIIGLPPINSITISGNMCFETSVNISWNSSSINNGVSYQGMVLSTSTNVMFMFNTNNTFYTFTNFSESTNCTVRIASVNTLGNGIYNMNTFYIPGQDDFALGGKYYVCMYVCIYIHSTIILQTWNFVALILLLYVQCFLITKDVHTYV